MPGQRETAIDTKPASPRSNAEPGTSADNILYGAFADQAHRNAIRVWNEYVRERDHALAIRKARETVPTLDEFDQLQDDGDEDGLSSMAKTYGLSEADLEDIFDISRNRLSYDPSNSAYKHWLELMYPAGTRVELLEALSGEEQNPRAPQPGDQGVITDWDDTPKPSIDWDAGAKLDLVLGDKFRLMPPEETLPEIPVPPVGLDQS